MERQGGRLMDELHPYGGGDRWWDAHDALAAALKQLEAQP
jgi:hypothetical protein